MIRGKKHTIKKRPVVNFDINTSIHNRFDIEVIDAKTGKVKQTARAFNIVCNYLWTCVLARSAYFNYIMYGSGTGTPSVEDKNLFEQIGYGSAGDSTYGVDYNEGVFWCRRKIQLSETTAVGKTITEVGIASSYSADYLCTHAMLEDMNGNAISIEKTDTDVINIYATVYVHFDGKGYDGGSIKLNFWKREYSLLSLFAGASLSYTPGHMVFTNKTYFYDLYTSSLSTGSFGLVPGEYEYSSMGKTASSISYSSDIEAKTLTITASRLGANDKNLGGIRRIVLAHCYYRSGIYDEVRIAPSMIITPGGSWFPYSDIVGEAIGTGDGATTDFSLSFPFAHDAKIYIDGVLAEDVVVDYGINVSGTIDNDVSWLDMATISEDNLIPLYATSSGYMPSQGWMFYNPMHEIGIKSIYLANTELQVSNNLSSWVTVLDKTGVSGTFEIPEEFRKYKYWKFVYKPYTNSISSRAYNITPVNSTGKVVHFTTPPAEGAVITADYHSDCIAKDANHVFDISLTFHFGDYTG